MDGTDWVYARLVRLARDGGIQAVRRFAILMRPDVLDKCVGMACADIDHASSKQAWPYEIVRDTCSELSRVDQ